MIGEPRDPIAAEDVKLYLSPPAEYEVTALVRGASKTGWTQQQDTDNAVTAMKAEAAALGANGVLLSGHNEGGNAIGGAAFSSTGATTTFIGGVASRAEITGQAIYVLEE